MEFVIVILIVLLCYRYHYDQYHNQHFITIIIIVMNMNLFFYNLCIFFPLLKIYHCDRIRGIWNIFTLRDQKMGLGILRSLQIQHDKETPLSRICMARIHLSHARIYFRNFRSSLFVIVL